MTREEWKRSWTALRDLVDTQTQQAQNPAMMLLYAEGGSMRKLFLRNFDLLLGLVDAGMTGADRAEWQANIRTVRDMELARLPSLAGDIRPNLPMSETIH
jgi:hypothetical protein